MIQSDKHIQKLPDLDFSYRTIELEKVHHYKQIVSEGSILQELTRYSYLSYGSILMVSSNQLEQPVHHLVAYTHDLHLL